MPYFFIEGASLAEGRMVELLPGDVTHAYRVLRLREGARLHIGNGRGAVYRGIITTADPKLIRVRLQKPAVSAEPPLTVTLLPALAKGEKMDLIVRQSVELGAFRIIPVVTGRSIPRWDQRKEVRRRERWQNIARAAAAQCRRARIPEVEPPVNFLEALDRLPPSAEGLTVVAWEGERELAAGALFRRALPPGGIVFLFTGPEGGFEESEINTLAARGALTVHLGPRILRTETAAAVSLALIQAAWGDLGGVDRS